MNNDIIAKIENIVLDLCKKNESGKCNHIKSVAKNSKVLCKKFGGDMEICIISALLHDISRIKGQREHHITGALEAGRILKSLGYPEDKIDKVKHCVLTHSADKGFTPISIEAKIVASADAISHFQNFKSICYAAFVKIGLPKDEGKDWILKKYEQSYNKIMPSARYMVKKEYAAIKLLMKN